jgi:hypothetical protein
MRDFKRTSASGMNLSQKDIEHIGNKIGNVLKRLPTGKSYDSAKEVVPLKYQKKLIGELKKDVKKGVISSEDLRDAQQIIKNLEI